jgi:hypothetical protein
LHLDQKIQNRLIAMGPVETEVAEKGEGFHLCVKVCKRVVNLVC